MNTKKIIDVFEKKIAAKKITGGSLIIFKKGEDFIYNFGTVKKDLHNYVTDNTGFAIGSATKIFTGLLVSIFIYNKKIQLSTTVGDILSGDTLDESFKSITIKELLTHTSGLPRLPDNLEDTIKSMENPYQDYGEDQLQEYLKYGQIQEKGKIVYSNLGYGLLGYLLEKIEKCSYSEILTSDICKPLHLRGTFVFDGNYLPPTIAQGYKADNTETPMWYMNILQGAGGIISTATDMKKFLVALLSKQSVLTEPVNQSLQLINKKMAYAWHRSIFILRVFGARNSLWHNGMTGGFASYIAINPKKKNGFALIYNKAVDPSFVSYKLEAIVPIVDF